MKWDLDLFQTIDEMVWDNAPFHRKKELQEIDGLTPVFLPSYSPELNPVERFYGEMRV